MVNNPIRVHFRETLYRAMLQGLSRRIFLRRPVISYLIGKQENYEVKIWTVSGKENWKNSKTIKKLMNRSIRIENTSASSRTTKSEQYYELRVKIRFMNSEIFYFRCFCSKKLNIYISSIRGRWGCYGECFEPKKNNFILVKYFSAPKRFQ